VEQRGGILKILHLVMNFTIFCDNDFVHIFVNNRHWLELMALASWHAEDNKKGSNEGKWSPPNQSMY
jgi:hypothetical protein